MASQRSGIFQKTLQNFIVLLYSHPRVMLGRGLCSSFVLQGRIEGMPMTSLIVLALYLQDQKTEVSERIGGEIIVNDIA